jgi:hypothetical protein
MGLDRKQICVLALTAILVACAGEGETVNSIVSTISDTTTTDAPTSSEPTWTYVAFGDSWPYGAHCNGCQPFPGLYAMGLKAATGHEIDFINLVENGGTSASLLADFREMSAYRDAIAKADIIMISTGANDGEPAGAAWKDGTCGGEDGLDCFREIAEGWRLNFDAMLTEIDTLRVGKPTAIRLVTNSNEFLADPGLIEFFGPDFGPNEGATYTAMHHDVLCEVAAAHSAQCVDLRPVLNGSNFDQPQDVNTQEAMQAVADALVASGLAELEP